MSFASPSAWIVTAALVLGVTGGSPAAAADFEITVHSDETPHLKEWAEDSKKLLIEWKPRLVNLLSSPGFEAPKSAEIIMRKTDEGVAGTADGKIYVSSHWIEKHPEDIGLMVHELVHVVQDYPNGAEFWICEGIADYIRWAIYEGKEQDWFQRPKEEGGYKQGYRVAGGFLLWIESNDGPGIVSKLNRALREGNYKPELFEEATGRTLDELWAAYTGAE